MRGKSQSVLIGELRERVAELEAERDQLLEAWKASRRETYSLRERFSRAAMGVHVLEDEARELDQVVAGGYPLFAGTIERRILSIAANIRAALSEVKHGH